MSPINYQKIRKTVFRFWLINLVMCIALFVSYRIVIIEATPNDSGFLGEILSVIDVFLEVSFSSIYLAITVIGSFTIFLNLIAKIRRKYILSFFTFSGIPLICTLYFLIPNWKYSYTGESPLRNMFLFLALCFLCTTTEFLIFRKKITR